MTLRLFQRHLWRVLFGAAFVKDWFRDPRVLFLQKPDLGTRVTRVEVVKP